MADIIIAFPKLDDAKNLKKLLLRNGYDVSLVCDNGAQVVGAVNELDGGVVICGYRFSDMHFSEILDYLPKGFQMLLMASPAKLEDSDISEIVSLPMPLKVQDLLDTLILLMDWNNTIAQVQPALKLLLVTDGKYHSGVVDQRTSYGYTLHLSS